MIRFAEINDIDKIMQFIDTYWKKGHILGTNKDFFEYEHFIKDEVTYVLSENESKQIEAILGYIPYGETSRDAMTVMWKVNHTNNPTLGIEMFNFLKDNADIRILASPGSNKKLKGLYSYLGYTFGKMNHWYRLNNLNEYKIAKILDSYISEKTDEQYPYIKFETWEQLENMFDFELYYKRNPKPLKEQWYIKKRYFDHPVYKYEVYGINGKKEKVETIFIIRRVEKSGSCAIRLIDCIGNYENFKYSTSLFDDLLKINHAEYIDCYEIGLSDDIFKIAGFRKTLETTNIIPNYFSPFVQENIDIYYFSTDADVVLFKGDGDQDRPS